MLGIWSPLLCHRITRKPWVFGGLIALHGFAGGSDTPCEFCITGGAFGSVRIRLFHFSKAYFLRIINSIRLIGGLVERHLLAQDSPGFPTPFPALLTACGTSSASRVLKGHISFLQFPGAAEDSWGFVLHT